MESELIKALPTGGSIIALIVVVVFFLRYLQSVTTSFQEQVRGLTEIVFRGQAEMSEAITDLATAVRQLEVRVDLQKKAQA